MKTFILNLLLIPMGCFGGSPKMPEVKETIPAPEEQEAVITASRDNERRRKRAAASQTILTSSRGVMGAATTSGKVLLGE